jgi:hypothetical protein
MIKKVVWQCSPNQVEKGTHQKKITFTIFLATRGNSYLGWSGEVGRPVTILAKLGQK